MADHVLDTVAVPRTEAIVTRLRDNREHFQKWLDTGRVKGKGGFKKALIHFDAALERGNEWAVKLALEYAIGKPGAFLSAIQYEEDGAAAMAGDIVELEQTVTATRRRRLITKSDL